MAKIIKRTDIIAFLNTTPSTESETWSLIGNKTNDLSYSYNPQKNTEQDVVSDNASTTVDGYQISMDGEMKCYYGDEVYDFINKLRYDVAIGGDAETTILLIDKYITSGASAMQTQKFNCTVSVNEYGGVGGETPTLSYSIDLNGNPTQGSVTFSGGKPTFTPTV